MQLTTLLLAALPALALAQTDFGLNLWPNSPECKLSHPRDRPGFLAGEGCRQYDIGEGGSITVIYHKTPKGVHGYETEDCTGEPTLYTKPPTEGECPNGGCGPYECVAVERALKSFQLAE